MITPSTQPSQYQSSIYFSYDQLKKKFSLKYEACFIFVGKHAMQRKKILLVLFKTTAFLIIWLFNWNYYETCYEERSVQCKVFFWFWFWPLIILLVEGSLEILGVEFFLQLRPKRFKIISISLNWLLRVGKSILKSPQKTM